MRTTPTTTRKLSLIKKGTTLSEGEPGVRKTFLAGDEGDEWTKK